VSRVFRCSGSRGDYLAETAHGRKSAHVSAMERETHAWRGRAASRRGMTPLNIDIPRPQRIGFNELAPRFDLVAHEHGENAVGFNRVVDLHFE